MRLPEIVRLPCSVAVAVPFASPTVSDGVQVTPGGVKLSVPARIALPLLDASVAVPPKRVKSSAFVVRTLFVTVSAPATLAIVNGGSETFAVRFVVLAGPVSDWAPVPFIVTTAVPPTVRPLDGGLSATSPVAATVCATEGLSVPFA